MQVNHQSAQPSINVTPLIDVLLVLLIIFIVISPMKPSRFEVKAPEKAEAPAHTTDDTLVVTVGAGGGYQLNSSPAATLNELEGLLHYALDARPPDRKATFIKAPHGLQYGAVVRVIDTMKAAGCAPIGLQLENLD
ncbi:MAG: biopolymer transporter ExbD [Acidobacteria bacterium]|nr:biopolymer transporter ExbD [Acidobacteriota bacterium]MBI3425865.1 biopolymer transporter ExbD [Acidobacteriota bacterium]